MSYKYRFYWDASVWISWNQNRDNLRDTCTYILQQTESGIAQIVLSPLVFAEFAPHRDKGIDDLFEQYLKRSSFVFVNITRTIGEQARELNRRYGLPGADALHLACAYYAKADYLHACDKHFLSNAEKIENIRICKPEWPEKRPDEQLTILREIYN